MNIKSIIKEYCQLKGFKYITGANTGVGFAGSSTDVDAIFLVIDFAVWLHETHSLSLEGIAPDVKYYSYHSGEKPLFAVMLPSVEG